MIEAATRQESAGTGNQYFVLAAGYTQYDLSAKLVELRNSGKLKECMPYILALECLYPQNQQLMILKCQSLLDLREYSKVIETSMRITDRYTQYQVMVVAHLGMGNTHEVLLWYEKWRELATPAEISVRLICSSTLARIIAIYLYFARKEPADREFSQWVASACKRKTYEVKGMLTSLYSILNCPAGYDEGDYDLVTKFALSILTVWNGLIIKDGSNTKNFLEFIHGLHSTSSAKDCWIFTAYGALCACKMEQYKLAIFYLDKYHERYPHERIPIYCTIPLKCNTDPDNATDYYLDLLKSKFSTDYPPVGSILRQLFEKIVEFMHVNFNVEYIK